MLSLPDRSQHVFHIEGPQADPAVSTASDELVWTVRRSRYAAKFVFMSPQVAKHIARLAVVQPQEPAW